MHIFVKFVQSYHINFLLKAKAQGGAANQFLLYFFFLLFQKLLRAYESIKKILKKNERRLQGDIISIDIVAVIRFIRCITLKSMFTFYS